MIFSIFTSGMLVATLYLAGQQRKITAHLIDGRRVKISCVVKVPDATRWTRGHFVIASGAWTWEPRASDTSPLALPVDVRPIRSSPPRGPETRRLSHRLLVMECTSVEGDVLIAALNGQVEHVFMALSRD